MNKKMELLAPAGNREKLEIAVNYGADAVYLGGSDFSLRNYAGNFSDDNLFEAIDFAHTNDVKVYITCNIYPRNHEIDGINVFFNKIKDIQPDGIIISDPGIILAAREIIPEIPIHLSTQANTTNHRSVQFWQNLGITRINTARELTLEEIATIKSKTGVEIEAFIHGAMCISYSGRCLLSSFMTNRDSNRGLCSHPCRWKYSVVEEMRPGDFYPVDEDSRGTYIFNSRDLCMIEHIPALFQAGIDSLKIEGRMKGINYLASVVKTYREAIDEYTRNPEEFYVKDCWKKELSNINNRGYSTGFYINPENASHANFYNEKGENEYLLVGKVLEDTTDENETRVEIRNKILINDHLEIIGKTGPASDDTALEIKTEKGEKTSLVQNGTHATIQFKGKYRKNDIIRKKSGAIRL